MQKFFTTLFTVFIYIKNNYFYVLIVHISYGKATVFIIALKLLHLTRYKMYVDVNYNIFHLDLSPIKNVHFDLKKSSGTKWPLTFSIVRVYIKLIWLFTCNISLSTWKNLVCIIENDRRAMRLDNVYISLESTQA